MTRLFGFPPVLTVQGQLDLAETYYQQAAAAAPGEVAHHHRFGLMLFENKRPNEAATCLRAALECSNTPAQQGMLRLDLGLALLEAGHAAEAADELQRAASGPIGHLAAPHYALGQSLMAAIAADEDSSAGDAGLIQRAIAAFSAALARAPHSAEMLCALGVARGRAGDAAAAATDLDRAVQLEPTCARLRALAGHAHAKADHTELAVVSCDLIEEHACVQLSSSGLPAPIPLPLQRLHHELTRRNATGTRCCWTRRSPTCSPP